MTDRFWPQIVIRLAIMAVGLELVVTCSRAGEAGASPYVERWVYCSANLQVESSVQDVIALLERSKKSGFATMLVADYKLQILDRVPDFYFRNVERVKEAARRLGIEKARESMAFFEARGHRRLIAGYFDVDDLSNLNDWNAAARRIPGVMGFMYTTWANRYGQLDTYGAALQSARRP